MSSFASCPEGPNITSSDGIDLPVSPFEHGFFRGTRANRCQQRGACGRILFRFSVVGRKLLNKSFSSVALDGTECPPEMGLAMVFRADTHTGRIRMIEKRKHLHASCVKKAVDVG